MTCKICSNLELSVYNSLIMRFLTIFLLLISLFACQRAEQTYTMSRVKLANVLADIHVADGASSIIDGALKDSITKVYYKQILEIHQVSDAEFRQNFDALKLDADEMLKVYKIINDTLTIRRNAVNK